jgi:hypothetical protein
MRKRKKPRNINHVDYEWINKKMGIRGGSYRYKSPRGLVTIEEIGDTNKPKIFYYNVVLLFKYFIRKLRR